MSAPYSILCFGHDQILVRTRQQLFLSAGFTSRVAHTRQELTCYFEEYAVDVLVICHSVTTTECEEAKQLAHSQLDPTLVLVLEQGASKCHHDEKDEFFKTSQGPERLLKTVGVLLRERGLRVHVARHKQPLPEFHIR